MVQAYLDEYEQLFPGIKAAYNGRVVLRLVLRRSPYPGRLLVPEGGQYTGFNGIQGQREGNLHFAGEHTSINFQGYVEGGLRSGYRCALEVMTKS